MYCGSECPVGAEQRVCVGVGVRAWCVCVVSFVRVCVEKLNKDKLCGKPVHEVGGEKKANFAKT